MDLRFLQLMLALGILLIVTVFASKISSRYGIPVLLIFLGAGMFLGIDGPVGLVFNDADFTHKLGTIALSFILFSGGLSTDLKSVAPVWKEGLILAFPGVLLSTIMMAFFIHLVIGWGWVLSALFGAAISSTDAAAVFGILKTQRLYLKPNIQSIIELESGSNDPMAVFMTVTLINLAMSPESFNWTMTLVNFIIQMSLGGLMGWGLGKGLVWVINWLDLEFEGLYPVLSIASILCLYALAEYLGGNGFLAVYLAGLTMGGEKYFSKKSLEVFHDGLAWLMQVAMFLAMGLLVYPSKLADVALPGIILALSLMFIARPLSVFLSLYGLGYGKREILFISWGGLRGAVPIILATFVLVSGVPQASVMFNFVFFIVIVCMLVQGSTLGFLAKWLKVQVQYPPRRRLPFKSRTLGRDFIEFEVGDDSPLIGKTILEMRLPEDVLVVLIHRGDSDFIPKGNTEIERFDRIVCLVDKKVLPKLEEILRPIHNL